MNYAERIAALPLPTLPQTAAFAEHVAENHSWYKHLPFFPPGATFVFFLNPHVGESVEEIGGRFTTQLVESGNYFRHHSRLATNDYRAQFGYWDYWVAHNPRVSDSFDRPWLYGVGPTGRELLPDELTRSWSCGLTAFLRFGVMLRASEFEGERAAFLKYAKLHPNAPDVETYRELARAIAPGEELRYHPRILAFWEKEAPAQLQLVQQTLMKVRTDCEAILTAEE